jgi:hypothetical protein
VLDATQISRFGKMQLHGALPVRHDAHDLDPQRQREGRHAGELVEVERPVHAAEFVQVASPSARFVAVQLAFTSGADGKATPVVEDVGIAYQIPNLPPQVKSIS